MTSKNKRVTYKHPIDENTDYLVPLQYDYNSSVPVQSKSSEKSPSPPGGLFGSVYLPISLILYVGVPISQLVIGLIYIGQCPVQQIIVVWMIVSGISGILLVIIGVIIHVKIRKQSLAPTSYDSPHSYSLLIKILVPIFVLILLFVIAWFFAGQVFVFEVKLHVEFFDSTLPEYCHGNLYKAAYILIFVEYLIFLFGILLNVLSCVVPPDEDNQKKRPTQTSKT